MRILVHWHIYYPEQIPYFLDKLSHIRDCSWDLYVTGVPQGREAVRAFKPDAVFLDVENQGYDIWPFISVLRTAPMEQYDYVLKLHTKNSAPKFLQLNGIVLPGYRWRNLLVSALLGTPKRFRKAWEVLEKDPCAGMVCEALLVKKLSRTAPSDTTLLQAEARRIGLPVKGDSFCAGTMFLARASAFEFLRKAPLDVQDFSGVKGTHLSGSPAHVYERILSLCISASGLKIVPLVTRPLLTVWSRIIVSLTNACKR
ncbi:MAG: hypothetical protein J5669_03050 [Bacteroidales bacterium]|nr:hypothetical protein [Bacteroidales bacterium]